MPAQTSLFQVYLRLRPALQNQIPQSEQIEPWLLVEPPSFAPTPLDEGSAPSHVVLQPPNDSRKRAVEKFGFTKVFRQEATQLDVFESIGTAQLVKNLLSGGRDGLVATLGVTGSGKSHTILGSRSQRGLTQMTLDIIFRSLGSRARAPDRPNNSGVLSSLQLSDPSEAQIMLATSFLENICGDLERGRGSRAHTPSVTGSFLRSQTPIMVGHPVTHLHGSFHPPPHLHLAIPKSPEAGFAVQNSNPSFFSDGITHQIIPASSPTTRLIPTNHIPFLEPVIAPSRLPFWNRSPQLKKTLTKTKPRKESTPYLRRHLPARPSVLPLDPDVSAFATEVNGSADYAVLISMYEVYNDRIFDLLSLSTRPNAGTTTTRQGAALQKDLRRRPLLFKSTEMSPDCKVVAGLRKILCGTYEEAMMILEVGLAERRVAGTGSNTASSRSHGFFCIEVKRRSCFQQNDGAVWSGGVLSIVDLAGSERARDAKTTGSTLAEAGKINESLMYLGQCLQVQSEQHDGSKPIVPFRQCKLTELLFSNSFSGSSSQVGRPPQKAVMIVTADPQGDFNATSQILRYSALAREVTVPRTPSITSTILNGPQRLTRNKGRQTPHGEQLFTAEEMEQAATEIARLSEELNQLAMRLAEEEIKRSETELKLQAAVEKALVIEQEVREDCWSQMEADMEAERDRWRKAKEEERVRAEWYVDGKIEILEKGVSVEVHEDRWQQGTEENLRENEALRRKVEALERQLNMRSPTKTKSSRANPSTPLKENINPASNPFLSALRTVGKESSGGDSAAKTGLCFPITRMGAVAEPAALEDLPRKVSVPKTPGTAKKVRKLTTRKWDFGNSDDEAEF